MEAFTFAVSTQVDFPIHVKMYAIMSLSHCNGEHLSV